MPQDVTCPKCNLAFPVTEARHAFTVACPACDLELTAEFKKRTGSVPAGEPHYEMLVRKGGLPTAAVTEEPRKKREDEDDEPSKGGGGSALIVFLSGGLGLLVVLGGLALTGWYLFTQIDITETTSNRSSSSSSGGSPKTGNKGNNPGGGNPIINPPPPKPKETTFDLRPVTGVIPKIAAPSLAADSSINLGGKVGAVAVGGGGRYIVMHLPEKGQLMLFDANTAQTSVAEADRENVLLTAGLTRLVVYVPSSKIFRVYSLPNLGKQFDASTNMFFGANSIAMGSRTDGPLLACDVFGEVFLHDLTGDKLTEIEAARGKPGIHGGLLRAAPGGNAFFSFDAHRIGQSGKLLTEFGKRWRVQDLGPTPFAGVDGCFYGNGVVVDRTGRDLKVGGIGTGSNTWYVPAIGGTSHFLKVAPTTVGKGPGAKKTIEVTIHNNRNANTPVAKSPAFTGIADFDNLADWNGHMAHDKPFDQHLFLIPEAKLLVILSGNKDKLFLRKVDI